MDITLPCHGKNTSSILVQVASIILDICTYLVQNTHMANLVRKEIKIDKNLWTLFKTYLHDKGQTLIGWLRVKIREELQTEGYLEGGEER